MHNGIAEGLKKFKQWLDDFSFADKIKAKQTKGKKKARREEINLVDDDDDNPIDKEKKLFEEFNETHQNARSKWKVGPNFPDLRVIDAYVRPQASRNFGEFEWPVPKLHRVRGYCRERLGWGDDILDKTIDPVIRKFAEKSVQTRIDSHFLIKFDDNKRAATIKSKRLAKQTGLSTPTKSPKKSSSNSTPNSKSPKKSSTPKSSTPKSSKSSYKK
jgi:hypothetical protein